MSDIKRDAKAWLIEQLQLGRSQTEIADELTQKVKKVSQPTVSRYLEAGLNSVQIKSKVEPVILALLALEEEEDARIEANQELFLAFMDAIQEWKRFEDFDAEQALIAIQRQQAAERAFDAQREAARAACKTVNDRLKAEGIMAADQRYIHGDGLEFFRAGVADFHYATQGAETVGFAEPDHRFPCGLTAEDLREGITPEERMRPTAVPAGQPRPKMIGIREASEVPDVPDPDESWFWGALYCDVSAWYQLRDNTPDWWKARQRIPRKLDDSDVTWYRRVLDLETKLLKKGLFFRQSILIWSENWADEVEHKASVLQTLKWRLAGIESASAAWKTARWATGVNAAIAVVLLSTIPTMFLVGKAIVSAAGGMWAFNVGTYQETFRDFEEIGEFLADIAGMVVISPHAFAVFLVVSLLSAIMAAVTGWGRTRSAEYCWMLCISAIFILLTAVTGAGSAAVHIIYPALQALATLTA